MEIRLGQAKKNTQHFSLKEKCEDNVMYLLTIIEMRKFACKCIIALKNVK